MSGPCNPCRAQTWNSSPEAFGSDTLRFVERLFVGPVIQPADRSVMVSHVGDPKLEKWCIASQSLPTQRIAQHPLSTCAPSRIWPLQIFSNFASSDFFSFSPLGVRYTLSSSSSLEEHIPKTAKSRKFKEGVAPVIIQIDFPIKTQLGWEIQFKSWIPCCIEAIQKLVVSLCIVLEMGLPQRVLKLKTCFVVRLYECMLLLGLCASVCFSDFSGFSCAPVPNMARTCHFPYSIHLRQASIIHFSTNVMYLVLLKSSATVLLTPLINAFENNMNANWTNAPNKWSWVPKQYPSRQNMAIKCNEHAMNLQQTMALYTLRYPQNISWQTDKPDPSTILASVLWWKLPASEWMGGTMADSNRSSTSIRCKWCIAKIATQQRKSGKPVCDLLCWWTSVHSFNISVRWGFVGGPDIWKLTDNFDKFWLKYAQVTSLEEGDWMSPPPQRPIQKAPRRFSWG